MHVFVPERAAVAPSAMDVNASGCAVAPVARVSKACRSAIACGRKTNTRLGNSGAIEPFIFESTSAAAGVGVHMANAKIALGLSVSGIDSQAAVQTNEKRQNDHEPTYRCFGHLNPHSINPTDTVVPAAAACAPHGSLANATMGSLLWRYCGLRLHLALIVM
jgi:hypothetical protein